MWHIPSIDKCIYLTFDDGPIPEITEFVLEELAKHNAKATFFCVGENIYKHPHIFKKIIDQNHAFGNHTYNHLKGWQVSNEVYFQNIEKFEHEVQKSGQQTALFRPPYGRISNSQAKYLSEKYKIVMWDVLTCDYDKRLKEDICLQKAIKYTKPGSIVLFHDSIKAEKNLRYVLPKYLAHFSSLGFVFKPINANVL